MRNIGSLRGEGRDGAGKGEINVCGLGGKWLFLFSMYTGHRQRF